MAGVDELVDRIYRICPTVQLPVTDFQVNQIAWPPSFENLRPPSL